MNFYLGKTNFSYAFILYLKVKFVGLKKNLLKLLIFFSFFNMKKIKFVSRPAATKFIFILNIERHCTS